jgi:ankyrin repeat protein
MEKQQETKRFFGRALDATKKIGKRTMDILAPKKLKISDGEQERLNKKLLKNANLTYYNPANIKRLVKKGADVNAQDKYGITVLMAAAGLGDIKTCKFLIKNGARVDLKDSEGKTAESIALTHVELDTVEMFARLSGNEKTLLFLKKIREH